jgi:hypothetical protein
MFRIYLGYLFTYYGYRTAYVRKIKREVEYRHMTSLLIRIALTSLHTSEQSTNQTLILVTRGRY